MGKMCIFLATKLVHHYKKKLINFMFFFFGNLGKINDVNPECILGFVVYVHFLLLFARAHIFMEENETMSSENL